MTLKEQYWKTGNIFRMSTGEYKMVWGEQLIGDSECIRRYHMSDDLYINEPESPVHVIEVYGPNWNAENFTKLTRPGTSPIWSRYDKVFTTSEILKALGIDENQNIFVLNV